MAVLPPDPVFNLRTQEMGAVFSICFHQNERLLAGTEKGSVFLWDLQTNRSPLNFVASTEPIMSLHHAEDHLITQEKYGMVKRWLLHNTGYTQDLCYEAKHTAFCRSNFVTDDGFLVTPHGDNAICLLSFDDFKTQHILDAPTNSPQPLGSISCLKVVSISGNYYVIAGYDSGKVITWDLRTYGILNQEQFNESPASIDFEPQTNRGLCGGSTDQISVFSYQWSTMEIVKKPDIGIKNAGINCIRIRPDHKVFVSGGWDGRIRIFSWKSLRPLAVLTEHKNTAQGGIMDIAFSSGKVSMWNAPIMAAAGADGQITLWDLYN